MWVSQTYLGCPDPNAKLFVYYLWESYKKQEDVPRNVIDNLTEMGRAFGPDISLFAPINGTQHEIRKEMRSMANYDFFWNEINNKTPGLLLIEKSLRQFDPNEDTYIFFDLPKEITQNADSVSKIFCSLHKECRSRLAQTNSRNQQLPDSNTGLLNTFYESVQLKLTFMGMGIDFKPIISWISRDKKR